MNRVKSFTCVSCQAQYGSLPSTYTCPACGGILDVVYDYGSIDGGLLVRSLASNPDRSIWRYEDLLPVTPGGPRPKLRVGGTPIYRARRLAEEIGLSDVFIKDDGVNPTASLKDRASAVAVAMALEAGAEVISCSSTGNAASSCAGCAASVGLPAVIFVPERAPAGKLAQLRIFNAIVIRVQGSYRDAFNLSREAIGRYGWYNRNAAINPYMVEGKKTVSFEICEELGSALPDWVVVSVGDGCTVAGVWKGFRELHNIGVIPRTPRILGVQAEGSNPISVSFRTQMPMQPGHEDTIADSIAVGEPRNPVKAVNAVRDSGGTMIDVSDEEILSAMRLLGRTAGVFGEPAGVAGLAGLARAVREGIIDSSASACAIVTGNGLKDIQTGIRAAGEPITIPPDIALLERELARVAPSVLS
ncbi:MAG TPA: threonine synthase [Bacillota bacterium]|nr:threonine synthase [Bacillota bacterium]HPU74973.1 threonine synthase [Bacillota bacterium]